MAEIIELLEGLIASDETAMQHCEQEEQEVFLEQASLAADQTLAIAREQERQTKLFRSMPRCGWRQETETHDAAQKRNLAQALQQKPKIEELIPKGGGTQCPALGI